MVERTFKRHSDGSISLKPTQPEPKRDLTWLEPLDQQERIRMLDKLDGALMGADFLAPSLGQTTTDYAEIIGRLRAAARLERQRLQDELDMMERDG